MPEGKLNWTRPAVKDARPLSGVVTLRADTSKTEDVSIVSFFVDGNLLGVTNYYPFHFEWNTKNHWNGLHELKIEARNGVGSLISSKVVKVLLSNADARGTTPISGPAVDELQLRLWNLMRLGESRELAHYYLGKMLLQAGDRAAAAVQLQYAIAYAPNLLDARALLSESRGSRFEYAEISKGKPGFKRIALTFVGGPNERTGTMLRLLDKLQVRGTFFVAGSKAEAQPGLIRAIVGGGHEIENLTYTHSALSARKSVDQEQIELAKGAAVILAVTGKPSVYFRPPSGSSDDSIRQAAARLGLTGIFWTLNCTPYETPKSERLADYVIDKATDGAIVLMHDGNQRCTAALPKLVAALRNKGYRFVTLSELLSEPK
jgi:peptidoglycan/xylan/chitin deacetylase (PgdA/CDA1 family)